MDLEECEQRDLVPAIRESLNAKLERLLRRPLVASLVQPAEQDQEQKYGTSSWIPDLFAALNLGIDRALPESKGRHHKDIWAEDPDDGTCTLPIAIDYTDLWRGSEREVQEMVQGTIESFVTFLTEDQRLLLERSPREFLALEPPPETSELVGFKMENVGGSDRVCSITIAERPESRKQLRYVAVVPNLIPLERQLSALRIIEAAEPDGKLAPLRALVGLQRMEPASEPKSERRPLNITDRLDEFQRQCVEKALSTPHFAAIQGPPGSGKTTVISTVIRQALARGQRVLVVSPTHVAVDNVVEKLVADVGTNAPDLMEGRTLPVRYASRPKKLLDVAHKYWVGPKKHLRAATLTKRLEKRLRKVSPLAEQLYSRVDPDVIGYAPLTQAVAGSQAVICGTPIGILSYDPVKNALPGAYDMLIVDEVSKMTLPEFLAVAVKAKRWVLVGDPEQLPPFNNAEENAVALDDLIEPHLELVCSIGSLVERTSPQYKQDVKLVVVSTDPERVAAGARTHLATAGFQGFPHVSVFAGGAGHGILVCTKEHMDNAVAALSPSRGRDRTHNPGHRGSVRILVELGVDVPRPEFASGARLVEPRECAHARVFDTSFNVYHAQPWQKQANQKLNVVAFRNGVIKYLPSGGALAGLEGKQVASSTHAAAADALIDGIAERYAVNVVSVYDWITGMPTEHFDTPPLSRLADLDRTQSGLRSAVLPFVGVLGKQYRMHPSLSKLPRDLFYFGQALADGKDDPRTDCRVRLVRVVADGPVKETNAKEADDICTLLSTLNSQRVSAKAGRQRILIITPYRKQEALINQAIHKIARQAGLDHIETEVCTLDRCQGREAEYVFISLVRGRSTVFLDAPKRWNVALTRAIEGLIIFGDIESYLEEAAKAHRYVRQNAGATRPKMSLLARVLQTYERQIADSRSLNQRSSR